jgi:hypothetical protein
VNSSADARLALVRVKIERAKKCFHDLETELGNFGDKHFDMSFEKTHTSFRQGPPDIARQRIRPFDALAIAGDVVHNLRTALDHLASQLVSAGSDGEPSRRVEFPIAKDAATYEHDKARKVEGMSSEGIKFIDALKPYKGGNESLWKIHELDNIDKHRTLFSYGHNCFLWAEWLSEYSEHPYYLPSKDPQFGGVFDSDAEKKIESEVDEAINKKQIPALIPSLMQLINYVETLVPTFKPFLE